MSEREEVLLEPGFVLHHRPYRNTSLIIDCLTGNFGRQSLVVQGARRPGARRAAELQPFRRVRLSWIRRRDMGRLTHVETDASGFDIRGDALLAAFYVNELMLRLLPGGDPNPDILNCYSYCLDQLAGGPGVARTLRFFELDLLEALGYRVDLDHDFQTGEPIRPDCDYYFEHEGGMTASSASRTMEAISGRHLISLREHRLEDADSLGAAKRLLGHILHGQLGGRPLRTRQVMRELVDRKLVF